LALTDAIKIEIKKQVFLAGWRNWWFIFSLIPYDPDNPTTRSIGNAETGLVRLNHEKKKTKMRKKSPPSHINFTKSFNMLQRG